MRKTGVEPARPRGHGLLGIDELAEDIRIRGQASAMFVYPMNDLYKLISGYRRKAALEKLGAEHALVRIFRNLDDEIAVCVGGIDTESCARSG